MFNGTNTTLSSDVARDTYGKVTQAQETTTHKRAFSQQVTTSLQETDKTWQQRQT